MFDWVVDGIRYLGWIIYVGMNYFISSIYNVLITIPNNLANILKNETVNSLFNASRNLFIIFVSLMIVVMVLSRLFDWNINKMLNQMKKIFLLCLILIALPWIFNQALKLTDSFIKASDNVMISEENNTNELDLGVNLANIYIYKNKLYENSSEYQKYDDDPFEQQVDITNSEIINQKIKDENGKEVYVYTYLNPVLGLIINLLLIGLLVLTAFKVYGYLYNIIVIKIWLPIKMIHDGFNDTPVSEAVYEIISAFTAFAIQLVIIPFSVLMLDIFSKQVGDNIFLQLVSVLVALWFMFTGVDYIQSKFQGKSGIPTVLEAYSFMKIAESGVSTIKSVGSSGDKASLTEQSTNQNYDFINTGREHDINSNETTDTNDFVNQDDDNFAKQVNEDSQDSSRGSGLNDNESIVNSTSNGDDIVNHDDNDVINQDDNKQGTESQQTDQMNNDNIDNHDSVTPNDEQGNETIANELNSSHSDSTIPNPNNVNNLNSGDCYTTSNANDDISNNQSVSDNDEVILNKEEVSTNNEDINNIPSSSEVSSNDNNNVIHESSNNIQHVSDLQDDKSQVNSSSGDINISDNDKINFPATNKQVEYARSLGINPEGKNKYELGREIENVRKDDGTSYIEPTWDKVEVDDKDNVSVEELEQMLNEDIKDD